MDEQSVISWWSGEVVLAADVGVPDGIGVGGGVRQERLVEAVLQDRGDRSVAGGADRQAAPAGGLDAHRAAGAGQRQDAEAGPEALLGLRLGAHDRRALRLGCGARSEERRVGTECVSKVRSRWSRWH